MGETERTPAAQAQEEEGGLLDLLIVLAKHKWIVVGLPLAAAIE